MNRNIITTHSFCLKNKENNPYLSLPRSTGQWADPGKSPVDKLQLKFMIRRIP